MITTHMGKQHEVAVVELNKQQLFCEIMGLALKGSVETDMSLY